MKILKWIVLFILVAIFITFYATIGKYIVPSWISGIVVISFIGVVIFFLQKNAPTNTEDKNGLKRDTDYGSANWTDIQKLAANGFNDSQGFWLGGRLINNKPGHLVTAAGTGQGKGTSMILPTLLLRPYGSYVITDPKGENACVTARWHKECGQKVFIIDPWNEQKSLGANHGIKISGFNPFDFIKSTPNEISDNCSIVASYLVPDSPNEKDPYWNNRARTLLKAVLLHLITFRDVEDHNFWTLYKIVRLSDENWLAFLLEMQDNKELDGLISSTASELIGLEKSSDKTAGIIKSVVHTATGIFESPQLRESLASSDFNPYNLPDGNCTVYVVIPNRYFETHGAWLRIVVGLSLKACNSRPNKRVNFILDEFAVMGKISDIQQAFAFGRGQNIRIWILVQGLSQLKQIYGEHGLNSFLSNYEILLATGVTDPFTQEFISKTLGNKTAVRNEFSVNTGYDGTRSTSSSDKRFQRPLMTPEEVHKLPGIVMITSKADKILLEKIYYYNVAVLKERSDENLCYRQY